jgi:SAM-dependent methyltransferase
MRFEQDHFSARAQVYALRRPVYPDALFEALAALTPHHALAWDCGTGSGQAARTLARFFERVFASDASREQIAYGFPHERVHYAIARAERAPLRSGAADFVGVAAAVHWFELDAFYAEALRVLRPGGALAVWTYLEMRVDPAFDAVSDRYIRETLKGDWPERMKYPLAHYENLPFPLEPLPLPAFESVHEWTLHEVRGFMETWSGTQRHGARTGAVPLDALWPELVGEWGDPDHARTVRWPLHVKAGRNGAP